MSQKKIEDQLTFGFEQTFTIPEWWTAPGFTSVSDTPLKRQKMEELAKAISELIGGKYIQSQDIWGHIQFETFNSDGDPSFVVTMDPGSIEVKTWPTLLRDVELMATPLFKAATQVNLVPYRNWWYGVQGGTEGGCHVNMGGKTPGTNPLKKNPLLVVQYAAYLHNRPWLTYPFQSLDVGPQGNAMRMDEKSGFEEVQLAFTEFNNILASNKKLSSKDVYDHFCQTNLITEKGSAPSLAKFKAPLYLIEDRAQESLRSPEDFKLVSQLRITILEHLAKSQMVEPLKEFTNLHQETLTSYYLWGEFQHWANSLELNPVFYQRFFDRQFPKLVMGKNQPKKFGIKEGRRPRVITDVQKRGDVVVSKTVDTRYKRFELYYYTQTEEQLDFILEAKGVEYQSPMFRHNGYLGFGDTGQAYFNYFDVKLDTDNPVFKISLIDKLTKIVIETAHFNANDMMWE